MNPLPPVMRTRFTGGMMDAKEGRREAKNFPAPAGRKRCYTRAMDELGSTDRAEQPLETFKKLPLGGLDRRALVGALAEHGLRVATEQLDAQRRAIRPAGT